MPARVAPGTIIVTTKQCPTHRLTNGAIVVVQSCCALGDAYTMVCKQYTSQEHARAAAAWFAAEGEDDSLRDAFEDAEQSAGDPLRIPIETAAEVFGARAWRQVAVPLGGDFAEEGEDPIVGTEVGPVFIPIVLHDGTVCPPAAKRFRVESKDDSCYTISYTHEGEQVTQRMRHGMVSDALKANQGPADFEVSIPQGSVGSLFQLLKHLPASKEIADSSSLSGLEAIAFLERKWVGCPVGGLSERMRDSFITAKLAIIGAQLDALPVDADREWPASSAHRLADQIFIALKPKQSNESGPQPNQADIYPLFSALRTLASSADDFDGAVLDSHSLNFSGRGDWGRDDAYVLRGGIERALKASESLNEPSKIKAYAPPSSLNRGELRALLDEAANEASQSALSQGQSVPRRSDHSDRDRNAKFEFTGKGFSQAEAAQAAQIRIDAQRISEDGALSTALDQTMTVAISNPSGLAKHLRELDKPEVQRVCASTIDLHNALNGKQIPTFLPLIGAHIAIRGRNRIPMRHSAQCVPPLPNGSRPGSRSGSSARSRDHTLIREAPESFAVTPEGGGSRRGEACDPGRTLASLHLQKGSMHPEPMRSNPTLWCQPPHAAPFAGIDIIVANKIMRIVAQLNITGAEGAFGEDTHLTDDMQKASKLARAGKFDLIRPSHLGVCATDKGGAGKPLQAIAEARNPLETFRSFMSKLQALIIKSHPSTAADAIDFLDRFTDVVVDAEKKGASWDEITPFYKRIMEKVTTRSRLFASAAAIAPSPEFNKEWLDERSRARCELNQVVTEAAIAAGLRKAQHESRGNHQNTGKYAHLKDDANRREPPTSGKDGSARATGVVAGAAVPLPKDKNDKARVDFRAKNPDGHVARKKKEMPPCWDYHHPQGCKRGDRCDFFHKP